jgi:hypothetical protein
MVTNKQTLRLLIPCITATVFLCVTVATAQTSATNTGGKSVLASSTVGATRPPTKVLPTPVYTAYRGISVGMTSISVRATLDHLKQKSDAQDLFIFSNKESAQVFYDQDGKVMAVSVNYLGPDSGAPSPREVLGEDLQAKGDGSIYKLTRYPAAGYWVSYSRTASEDPLVSITIQKIP